MCPTQMIVIFTFFRSAECHPAINLPRITAQNVRGFRKRGTAVHNRPGQHACFCIIQTERPTGISDKPGSVEMNMIVSVNGIEYEVLKLLGHGKGGYSYLASSHGKQVVLKQIHHEPCDYYTFGNKIESEKNDYQRLKDAVIRIPMMITVDETDEIIIKEYIEGLTVYEMVRDGISVEPFLIQIREMAELAKKAGLNIDYFPTNFVVRDGLIYYVDYECNPYSD